MASRSNKSVRYAQPAMASSAPKTPPRAGIMNSVRSAVSAQKPKMNPSFRQTSTFVSNTQTDRNGNRTGARPQVGQADPATRRAALDAALRPGPAVKPAPAPVKPAGASLGLEGGIGGKKRAKKIDDYVTNTAR